MPNANGKVRERYYSMVNTTYSSTQEMNIKLQSSKRETILKLYQNISNYCDEINYSRQYGNFEFEE